MRGLLGAITLIAALVLCFPSLGQADTTSQTQTNLTGIVSVFCDQNANAYVIVAQNGYGTQVNFTTVLQCDGAANASVATSISLFAQQQIQISPPDQTLIKNRVCRLIMTGVNPFTGKSHTFSQVEDSCGVIDLSTYKQGICGDCPADDHGQHCDWDMFCQLSNGTWWRSFTFLICVWIVISLVMLTVYVLVFELTSKARRDDVVTLVNVSKTEWDKWAKVVDYAKANHFARQQQENLVNQQQFQQLQIRGGEENEGPMMMMPGGGPARNGPYYDGDEELEQPRGRSRGPRGRSRGPAPLPPLSANEYDVAMMTPDPRMPQNRGYYSQQHQQQQHQQQHQHHKGQYDPEESDEEDQDEGDGLVPQHQNEYFLGRMSRNGRLEER